MASPILLHDARETMNAIVESSFMSQLSGFRKIHESSVSKNRVT